MQVKCAGCPTKAKQALFGIPPEAFNSVDVITTFGKFVLAMINPKMLAVTHIDQTMIAARCERYENMFQQLRQKEKDRLKARSIKSIPAYNHIKKLTKFIYLFLANR